MTTAQTAEETALIAKWNAGDYSAEGWVNNTEGLTEEALNGLAAYNTKKHFDVDNLTEEDLAQSPDVNVAAVLQGITSRAIADARMGVTTGRVNNVPAVIAVVYYNFTAELRRFYALFERQGSAGNASINGQVRWETSSVSDSRGPAVLQRDPPPTNQVVLSATTTGVPPSPRLQFTGPSGSLSFTQTFRGTGYYRA